MIVEVLLASVVGFYQVGPTQCIVEFIDSNAHIQEVVLDCDPLKVPNYLD